MFFQLDCSLSAARLSRAGSPLTPAFASQKIGKGGAGGEMERQDACAGDRNGNGVYTLNQAATPPPLFHA